jgi:hypothetical protein
LTGGGGLVVDSPGSEWGRLAGCYECGDEPLGFWCHGVSRSLNFWCVLHHEFDCLYYTVVVVFSLLLRLCVCERACVCLHVFVFFSPHKIKLHFIYYSCTECILFL